VGADGQTIRLTADAHLAAHIGPNGGGTLIEKPIPGAVGTVRAVSLEGRRWGVLFDEVVPDSAISRTLGLWYAEHDGESWSVVERVPLPARGRVDFSSSSELVVVPNGLVWVVAARLEGGLSELLEYERREGRWQSRAISDYWVEVSSLAYSADSGLWLTHFAVDSGDTAGQRALRLFRRTGEWELVQRVFAPPLGESVYDPRVTIGSFGVDVAWRTVARDGSRAHALVGLGPNGGGTPVDIGPAALQLISLGTVDQRPSWLVFDYDEQKGAPELRLLTTTPTSAVATTLVAPSPYPGGFVAALPMSSSQALVVGADVSLEDAAHSYVRSFILRLSRSCL
jgi:hypothetical protein